VVDSSSTLYYGMAMARWDTFDQSSGAGRRKEGMERNGK
jgi:hypothetical protein